MEDFVPFEIAQKLKEKGFDYPCIGHYVNNQLYIAHYQNAFHSDKDESLDAPTISQVLKWLRGKDIMVEIPPVLGDDGTWLFSFRVQTKKLYDRSTKDYTSYESAALACIEHVLDNLI